MFQSIKRKTLLLFSFLMLLCFAAYSQTVDTTGITDPIFPGGETTVGQLVNIWTVVYGAIIILWGYIARIFKL